LKDFIGEKAELRAINRWLAAAVPTNVGAGTKLGRAVTQTHAA